MCVRRGSVALIILATLSSSGNVKLKKIVWREEEREGVAKCEHIQRVRRIYYSSIPGILVRWLDQMVNHISIGTTRSNKCRNKNRLDSALSSEADRADFVLHDLVEPVGFDG